MYVVVKLILFQKIQTVEMLLSWHENTALSLYVDTTVMIKMIEQKGWQIGLNWKTYTSTWKKNVNIRSRVSSTRRQSAYPLLDSKILPSDAN